MATLTIDEKKAREIYPVASAEIKTILEDSFGGKSFFNQKITDRIFNFEDVCREAGVDPNDRRFTVGDADDCGYQQVKLLVKVLNEGWVPDYNDPNQKKWGPWFYLDKPGFRFVDSAYDFSYSNALSGSRLVFADKTRSDHAGKHFLDIYRKYLC